MEGQQGAQAASTGASCGWWPGSVQVGVPPSRAGPGRAGQAACGKGLQSLPRAWQEKAGWREGGWHPVGDFLREDWPPASGLPAGAGRGGPDLKGFPPPQGHSVQLRSEGWKCSHDFGHLTDLGL